VSERAGHRYLLALPRGDRKVFLSWRLRKGERRDLAFHVERRGEGEAWERVSAAPITDSTTFVDQAPEARAYDYRVVAGDVSEVVSADAAAPPDIVARSIALDPEVAPAGLALGELTNDGRIGYAVRAVRAGQVWILAYDHDGALRWARDTRLPARGGWDGSTLHVPLLCWDVNGDGRTEVAFHTTRAEVGEEYGTAGPDEFLTVVDAETGETVWEVPWPAVRSRVMMTVGHLRSLDRPASVVVLDETYGDVTLTAVDGSRGEVSWRIAQQRPAGHNLDIADVDGDGVQEVICGGLCYHGDGRVKWEAEPFGHTDISKPARIDPSRPGLQIWYAVESGNPGVYLVDRDGRTIFKEPFRHAHYGWVCRHTARVPGLQMHAAEDARHEYGAAGAGAREEGHFPIFLPDGTHWANLTDWQRKSFVPVHWDEGPEVVFAIRKENKRLVRFRQDGSMEDLPEGTLPEGGQYGRNLACADVMGDCRENIVTFDADQHRLVVLANPTPMRGRGYSPYDDFAYRHDRSQHASGYYIYLSPPYTAW
jgi:hypothetical protein